MNRTETTKREVPEAPQPRIQVSVEISQQSKSNRVKRTTKKSQAEATATPAPETTPAPAVEVIDVENDKNAELCCIDLTKEDTEIAVIQEVRKKSNRANNQKRATNQADLDATIIIDEREGCASPPKRARAVPQAAAAAKEAPRSAELCCPVCLDNLDEIKTHKKTLMSTFCGHIICSTCMEEHFKASVRCGQAVCPTCRTKISRSKIHSLYL